MALRLSFPRIVLLLIKNRRITSVLPPIRYYNRNPVEVLFGAASNVFRNFEKELDRAQRQFNGLSNRSEFGSNSRNLARVMQYPNERPAQSDMIVTESDGTRKFLISFDMHDFEPEEVKIITENGVLTITAKKEKKDKGAYSLREFSQSYSLPAELNIEDLKSTFSEDGILSIEALLPKTTPKDRTIKIEHKK
ncbi:unnamed protein product [Didymodactylos carnosus]|uniref:SHSP domain-containing protein n=1 Tax=Didymodactylos carnosus TaxID=1234261 RepID=A0A814HHM9_9BILA|nr:unnamed protein product [Didymodactylos carnosus]CAF3782203.1 unnamed protein product [Didymodactylos carnosus]